MLLSLKVAAVGAAALLGGTAAADTCTCKPPETETISCTDGVPSFPKAVCTQGAPAPPLVRALAVAPKNLIQVSLACPPGETAISAGFRRLAGLRRPLLDMSPVVPLGTGHANRYLFTWRLRDKNHPGAKDTDLRVYVTCQRD